MWYLSRLRDTVEIKKKYSEGLTKSGFESISRNMSINKGKFKACVGSINHKYILHVAGSGFTQE